MRRFFDCATRVSLFALMASAAQGQTPSVKRASPVANVDGARTVLVAECSVSESRSRDEKDWDKVLRELGLQRKDDVWELVDATGKLRLLRTGGSCWIIFFPARQEAVPDAILGHMLRDARYTSVDGDTLEIGLAPIEQLTTGARIVKNITVSIAGGRFLASRTMIDWDKPNRE